MANSARRIGRKSRPSAFGRRLGAGWVAVLLATLLAFSWQSFVAETHNHLDRAPRAATGLTTIVAAKSPDRGAPSDSPANCPICRELAHSANYIPPAPIALPAPRALLVWLVAGLAIGLTLGRRSVGWRSRAPPLPLHA